MPMMAITTNNSINVNAECRRIEDTLSASIYCELALKTIPSEHSLREHGNLFNPKIAPGFRAFFCCPQKYQNKTHLRDLMATSPVIAYLILLQYRIAS
jgi:hypothetical protein